MPWFLKEGQASQGCRYLSPGLYPGICPRPTAEKSVQKMASFCEACFPQTPRHNNAKRTILRIAKASPPQAGWQRRRDRIMVALCSLILGSMSIQLGCYFSPWSPASLSAAMEGLNSRTSGRMRLLPVDLDSFHWRTWKVVSH